MKKRQIVIFTLLLCIDLIVLLPFFQVFALYSVPYNRKERQKLDASLCTESSEWYEDDIQVIEGETGPAELTQSLKKFYEETGVQPYLVLTSEGNFSIKTEKMFQEYLRGVYWEHFQDEGHVVIGVFRSEDSENDDTKMVLYVGKDAESVIDAQANNIITSLFQSEYWKDRHKLSFDLSGTVIRTIEKIPDYIMKEQYHAFVGLAAAGALLILVMAALSYAALSAGRQAAEAGMQSGERAPSADFTSQSARQETRMPGSSVVIINGIPVDLKNETNLSSSYRRNRKKTEKRISRAARQKIPGKGVIVAFGIVVPLIVIAAAFGIAAVKSAWAERADRYYLETTASETETAVPETETSVDASATENQTTATLKTTTAGAAETTQAQSLSDTELREEKQKQLRPDGTTEANPYTKPQDLGDDILDARAQINGVIYQFPIPMNELLNDGWVFLAGDDGGTDTTEDTQLDPQEMTFAILSNSEGQELNVDIMNLSTSETAAARDCAVTSVTDFQYLSAGVVVSGGYHIGTQQSDIEELMADYQQQEGGSYQKDEQDQTTFYNLNFPMSETPDGIWTGAFFSTAYYEDGEMSFLWYGINVSDYRAMY